jgi:hypothetical protein
MRRPPRPQHSSFGPAWSLPPRSGGARRGGHLVALTLAAFLLAVLLMLGVLAEQAHALLLG